MHSTFRPHHQRVAVAMLLLGVLAVALLWERDSAGIETRRPGSVSTPDARGRADVELAGPTPSDEPEPQGERAPAPDDDGSAPDDDPHAEDWSRSKPPNWYSQALMLDKGGYARPIIEEDWKPYGLPNITFPVRIAVRETLIETSVGSNEPDMWRVPEGTYWYVDEDEVYVEMLER